MSCSLVTYQAAGIKKSGSTAMTQDFDLSKFHDPKTIGSNNPLSVYVSKEGVKPLIVLHELPGMTPSFISYCKKMAAEGFKVYMPLIFKSPGTDMGRADMAKFCLSYEFRELFHAKDSKNTRPFTAWLLELVQEVSDDNPDTKIGVVGMCLTGGFAIAAIARPEVEAVAACQPAFPFLFKIQTLGLSVAQRQSVRDGIAGKSTPCVKAYRYENDILSRKAHIRAAKDLLDTSLDVYPELSGKGHSTLTTTAANPEVYKDVLKFLNAQL